MIRNVDKNCNGAIDFNEFIEMMLRRDSKIEEDVRHAFRVFDRDGDGLIFGGRTQTNNEQPGRTVNRS